MGRRAGARLFVVSGLVVATAVACTGPPSETGAHRPGNSTPSRVVTPTPSTTPPTATPTRGRPSPSRKGVRPPPYDPTKLRGTNAWNVTDPALQKQIEGYTVPVSGLPGTDVRLMVSTVATSYRVQAYRLGGYEGGTGRLIWSSGPEIGHQEAAPTIVPATRTAEARWPVSLRVDTSTWPPGFYLFKLEASDGHQWLVPYVVRSVSTAGKVVLSASFIDWEAYNTWGGYSLYVGPPGQESSWAVSFDRPSSGPEAGLYLFDSLGLVVLAEQMHLPLAYESDVAVATHPRLLDGARAYVSVGHDEYWTIPERQHVTAARDAGTNLLFTSSNDIYWRVRLGSTWAGHDQLVICYKIDAPSRDPDRTTHPALTTTRWRDPPHPDPENSLTGMQYECYPVDSPYRVASPGWWGFAGTGVHRGSAFPGLIEDEADRVYPIASTPRPLQILSYTPYDCGGVPTSSESTYYTTPSGAGVVDVGTQFWDCALRTTCRNLPTADDVFVRRVTHNILEQFAKGPVGNRLPAHDNVAHFPLPKVNQVPAS